MSSYVFPDDFTWGVATASYQIEGAHDADGRKPSVWDTFSATPGRVLHGHTGMVACDHYHRYEEDVALMAELGVKHYRFSIAWPRILPDGTGTVNEAGIDFYKRLLDCLHKHDITPHATLFHWDSPQALEDRYGSWRSRQMAYDFADYVEATVSRLADRVRHWMTINEIMCFAKMGYHVGEVGQHAPGTPVNRPAEQQQAVHHALLAHGLGCQAIRAQRPDADVALVDNYGVAVPVTETAADIAAAGKAFRQMNGDILVPALTGAYEPGCFDAPGREPPLQIDEDDLATINQPLDRLGLNIYSGCYARAADNEAGYQILPLPKGYPRLHMPWLNILPDIIYWGTRHISEAMQRPDLPVFISENGCACEDEKNADGEIIDLDRVLYLREHFRSAHRAVSEGYPLTGYFVWSFMDNFEWSWGYDRRFGITHVDYQTQQRTPKQSFRWYQQVIKENRVM